MCQLAEQVSMTYQHRDLSDKVLARRWRPAFGGVSSIIRLIGRGWHYAYTPNPFSLMRWTSAKKVYLVDLISSRDRSRIIYCLANVPSEAG
jgi:hypothetical protein